MPGESYRIDAQLRLNTSGASAGVATFQSRLAALGRSVSGAQSGIMGMVGGLAGMAAGVVTIGALASAFERVTSNAVAYRTQMEGLELQTSAVMSAVDHIGFEQARGRAHALFEQYRVDAIASVATTEQLVSISNAIMGPLRGAGESMRTVRDMTNMTVTASTALGVDLAQASRDMQLMINGSAGMHVRLYQMLHATGAIAEDAHAFNALTSTERIARLQTALGRFQGAATAYGQSFAGATSTFQDIVDNLTSTFYGPAFDRLRQFLLDVNERLISNREAIETVLRRAGNWFAQHVQVAFDTMLSGMDYIGQHWDEIVTKGQAFVQQIRDVIPRLMEAAKLWAGISIARSLVGGGMQGAAGLMGMLPAGARGAGAAASALGIAASPAATRFETALAQATPALMSMAGGVLGTPLAAGEIGPVEDMFAAAAARASMAAPLGGIGAAAAPAVEASGLAALAASLAPVAAVVAVAAAAFVAIGAVIYGVTEHLTYFQAMGEQIMPMLAQVGSDLMTIGGDIWAAVSPLMELFGFTTANNAGGALAIFLAGLHRFLELVHLGTSYLRDIGAVFQRIVTPMIEANSSTAEMVATMNALTVATNPAAQAVEGMTYQMDMLAEHYAQTQAALGMHFGTVGGITGRFGQFWADGGDVRHQAPADFRGSHITIQQEFREADPDRVLLDIVTDLERQAESRVQSGLSGIGR